MGKTTERFIREAECREISGLGPTARYMMEQRGEFPRRIKLTSKAAGWWLPDVIAWQQERRTTGNEAA